MNTKKMVSDQVVTPLIDASIEVVDLELSECNGFFEYLQSLAGESQSYEASGLKILSFVKAQQVVLDYLLRRDKVEIGDATRVKLEAYLTLSKLPNWDNQGELVWILKELSVKLDQHRNAPPLRSAFALKQARLLDRLLSQKQAD